MKIVNSTDESNSLTTYYWDLAPGGWRGSGEVSLKSPSSIPHPAQSEVATAARNSEDGTLSKLLIFFW